MKRADNTSCDILCSDLVTLVLRMLNVVLTKFFEVKVLLGPFELTVPRGTTVFLVELSDLVAAHTLCVAC